MYHCNISVTCVTLVPWRRERRHHVSDWRIGNLPERLIYFEYKLNEPMHISMRYLYLTAMPCSMGINRQQVQHILESVTQPFSGGTATVVTGRDVSVSWDVPFQLVTFNVTSVTDELGIPTKAALMLPLPVPCIMIPRCLLKQKMGQCLHREGRSLLFLHNPLSETWITLGKCALPTGKEHCGSQILHREVLSGIHTYGLTL